MDTLLFKRNTFTYSYKGGLRTSSYEDLLAIESDKPFVKLNLTDSSIFVRASLNFVETNLQQCYVRISRQVIVNINLAQKITLKNGSYWIHLSKGLEYKISERRQKDVCFAFIKNT